MYSVIAEKAELMITRINPGDKIVACGYSDGFVKIFHLRDQIKLQEYNTAEKEHVPVTSLRWRPSNT